MFGRARQSWRDKAALMAPLGKPVPGRFLAGDLLDAELRKVLRAGGPALDAYQGLAGVWDDYCAAQLPDYPSFLAALARRRGRELGSVLDLACGTGTLTERLAGVATEVVGLDASAPMLARARIALPTVTFVDGDFRRFDLGRTFDAVVCASNSLNYVRDRGELAAVFTAVRQHLTPGGRFVFDTVTASGMRYLSGRYLHIEAGGQRFAIRFSYDAAARVETSDVIFRAGIERHRRVPIDPDDVRAAAAGAGLRLDDHFGHSFAPGRWWTGRASFFVVSGPG